MSFIKKFLIISSLAAVIVAPQRVYSQEVINIPSGSFMVRAGIAAIFGYMLYMWCQQKAPAAPQTKNSITANELFRAINHTFKIDTEDCYAASLDAQARNDGYRVYLPNDEQAMVRLFDTMRVFVDQIAKQEAPNVVHSDIDTLAQELENELAQSEKHVKDDVRQQAHARAARGAYYVARCNAIVINAAVQQ